jgi:gas vesicle protein
VINENNNHEIGEVQPWSFWAGLPTGLLIGGLAGAVSMWLLAPQSGKRTRARLMRQGQELREHATETMDDAVTSAKAKAHQITQ